MPALVPSSRLRRLAWATWLVAAPLAACGAGSAAAANTPAASDAGGGAVARAPVTPNAPAAGAPGAWSATLAPPAAYTGPGHVTGTAAVAAPNAAGAQVATVAVTGAVPNSVHPWHVHRGTCGADSGIVDGASTYPAMRTDTSGAGRATATLPTALAAGGSYMVNVHASPSDLKTIVACGPLTAAAQ